MGDSLGVALAMLMDTFNVPLYMLNGGMLPASDVLAPQMLQTLEERSFIYRQTKSETHGEKTYLPWLEK